MNKLNATGARLSGGLNLGFRAVQADGAGIAPNHTSENFHQRRFAGAVFANQSDNFMLMNFEIDILERAHAGEALGDTRHLENWI
jgi:hypothetical protein